MWTSIGIDAGIKSNRKTGILMKKLCPFISTPHKNCHCIDMNSLKTRDALYYCSGDFDKCEIYVRHSLASIDVNQVTREE
jgi:hypothetical protein